MFTYMKPKRCRVMQPPQTAAVKHLYIIIYIVTAVLHQEVPFREYIYIFISWYSHYTYMSCTYKNYMVSIKTQFETAIVILSYLSAVEGKIPIAFSSIFHNFTAAGSQVSTTITATTSTRRTCNCEFIMFSVIMSDILYNYRFWSLLI